MKIFRYTIAILMLCTSLKAQDKLQLETQANHEDELSLEMCRSLHHRFDLASNQCVYCAQGLHYDKNTSQCAGTPDVLGKCFGEDHYRAKTQECKYCAKGYLFDEDIRECMPLEEKAEKQ